MPAGGSAAAPWATFAHSPALTYTRSSGWSINQTSTGEDRSASSGCAVCHLGMAMPSLRPGTQETTGYFEPRPSDGSTDAWTGEKTTSSGGAVYFVSVALFVIAATIFGNILVIVAVVTEKRLRKVGNTFIISLAISDLLVGLFVTPVALLYHVSDRWTLGWRFCDTWVSLDVICCTASIINLCVISFDRYNAITRPLQYALKRTPHRAAGMIAFVWTYSILIAVPPLLGWKEFRPRQYDQCTISKDAGYTVFSTVGAFYAPLVVMLTMYAKIFNATVKRKRNWLPGPRPAISRRGGQRRRHEFAVLINATDSVRKHYQNNKDGCPEAAPRSPAVNPHVGYRLMRSGAGKVGASLESIPDYDSDSFGCTPHPSPRPSLRTNELVIPKFSITSTSGGPTLAICKFPSGGNLDQPKEHLRRTPSCTTTTTATLDTGTSLSYDLSDSDYKPGQNFFRKSFRLQLTIESTEGGSSGLRRSQQRDLSPLIVRSPSTSLRSQSPVHETTFNLVDLPTKSLELRTARKKGKISISQERTAAKTLGIIIGGFTLCWLPFFLVTLIGPFCVTCKIPVIVKLGFTWLGYFNSALNPIIYTFFNPDFRKAFRKILSFQLSK